MKERPVEAWTQETLIDDGFWDIKISWDSEKDHCQSCLDDGDFEGGCCCLHNTEWEKVILPEIIKNNTKEVSAEKL